MHSIGLQFDQVGYYNHTMEGESRCIRLAGLSLDSPFKARRSGNVFCSVNVERVDFALPQQTVLPSRLCNDSCHTEHYNRAKEARCQGVWRIMVDRRGMQEIKEQCENTKTSYSFNICNICS